MKYIAGIGKLLIFLAFFSLSIHVVYAQNTQQIGDDISHMCNYAGAAEANNCRTCATNLGVWTAIGCIPTSPSGLFAAVFRVSIGIAGGIAFLLIIFGGFQILMSAGNPEQLNEGRELISSAVAGLLLIIFSVFILRLIGVNILGVFQ